MVMIYIYICFYLGYLLISNFAIPNLVSPNLEEQLKAAEYQVVVTNLSHDFKEAVSYNLRKNKVDGSRHVAEVSQFLLTNVYLAC